MFEIANQNLHVREEDEKFLRREVHQGKSWIEEGECDECGAFGMLYSSGGKLLCDECEMIKVRRRD